MVAFSSGLRPITAEPFAMIFQSHIPRFPLSQFVDHFVYYEGYHPEHSIDRFLPDGNTEIIIDFDELSDHTPAASLSE